MNSISWWTLKFSSIKWITVCSYCIYLPYRQGSGSHIQNYTRWSKHNTKHWTDETAAYQLRTHSLGRKGIVYTQKHPGTACIQGRTGRVCGWERLCWNKRARWPLVLPWGCDWLVWKTLRAVREAQCCRADDQVESSCAGSQRTRQGAAFPVRVRWVLTPENQGISPWGPLRHKRSKAAHGILGLLTHICRQKWFRMSHSSSLQKPQVVGISFLNELLC